MLNSPDVNISTIEDPIEYDIRRVNQIQVNAKTGLTFAEGLRAILRQDPNIVMVGEIRDTETAEMAVHSALTGHLVLSTLHTNSAAGAIPRLIDIGVEPFLLSSTINLIIAQRLVRRICSKCITSKELNAQDAQAVYKKLGITSKTKSLKLIYEGKGCKECSNTGYRGQIGIYEVLVVTDKIKNLAVQRASSEKIEEQAKKENMQTMLEDGLLKVEQGVTTVEEVARVIRE